MFTCDGYSFTATDLREITVTVTETNVCTLTILMHSILHSITPLKSGAHLPRGSTIAGGNGNGCAAVRFPDLHFTLRFFEMGPALRRGDGIEGG